MKLLYGWPTRRRRSSVSSRAANGANLVAGCAPLTIGYPADGVRVDPGPGQGDRLR